MEELKKYVFDELSKNFTQSTSNISTVSRTWALTIIAPCLAMFYKYDCPISIIWPLIIVGLSILCLMFDGIQYLYSASKTKKYIDGLYDNKISLDEIPALTRQVYQTSFRFVFLKFCILLINTILLMIFVLIMSLNNPSPPVS